MGGYLKIIDALAHPDAQVVARQICPEAITNNVLRAALDLQQGGDHDVDIPPATKLKEYLGEYSTSRKAYRTYGRPNRAFEQSACILMEYTVEIQAQHRPDRLNKPRTESVGTDRLGRVPSRLGPIGDAKKDIP